MNQTNKRGPYGPRKPKEASPMPDIQHQPPESAFVPVATGTETVVVCCKLPQGHRARLHSWIERDIEVNGVRQKMRMSTPTGEEMLFKGPAHGQNEGPRVAMAGGFGLTFGVPKDFWDKWVAQHGELDLVKKGLIFARESNNKAIGAAKERRDESTGLSRIDPRRKIKQSGVTMETAEGAPAKFGRFDDELAEMYEVA